MPPVELILASGSPRRQELLSWTGWKFRVLAVDTDETPLPCEAPVSYVSRLAEVKARAAGLKARHGFILAADTTVADGTNILGKPQNGLDAAAMLTRLRGKQHQGFTALAMLNVGNDQLTIEVCATQVRMRNYSDEEIATYVASGDPLDKAGAYAIQNLLFRPVENFAGCFANVMGLPLCHLARMSTRLGIPISEEVASTCQRNLQYDCPVYKKILSGEEAG
jgi:septum formation protein